MPHLGDTGSLTTMALMAGRLVMRLAAHLPLSVIRMRSGTSSTNIGCTSPRRFLRGVLGCSTVRQLAINLSGWPQRVRCQAPVRPVLLHTQGQQRQDVQPHFDWRLFWELVRPDLWLLLAAVATAMAAAVLNVQLPLQIGALVNAVAKSDMVVLKARATSTLCYTLTQVGPASSQHLYVKRSRSLHRIVLVTVGSVDVLVHLDVIDCGRASMRAHSDAPL